MGTITDIVATIGAFAWKTPILQQSLEELRKVYSFIGALFFFVARDLLMRSFAQDIFDDKLQPNFLVAKYFLPLIQDREGTSYTVINGTQTIYPLTTHLSYACVTTVPCKMIYQYDIVW